MNNVAERTNGHIVSKARYLFLDAHAKIDQSFWLKAFSTSIYLLNCSLSSFLKYDCPLAVWLRVYNSNNESYTLDLSYLRTFDCRVDIKILVEKRVKS